MVMVDYVEKEVMCLRCRTETLHRINTLYKVMVCTVCLSATEAPEELIQSISKGRKNTK